MKAYALVFRDGQPFIKSISDSRKTCIKQAEKYFCFNYKEMKNKGMRLVVVDVNVCKD